MKIKKIIAGILLLTLIVCGWPDVLYASGMAANPETDLETTADTEGNDTASDTDLQQFPEGETEKACRVDEETERIETEESETEKWICGFMSGEVILDTVKGSLETLSAQFPETVDVVLRDGSQETIDAVWVCDDDYEQTDYETYVFNLVIPEGYVPGEELTAWDVPYIEVHIRPDDGGDPEGQRTGEAQDGDIYIPEGANVNARAAAQGTVSIIWYSVAAGSGLGALLGDGKEIDHICYMQIKVGSAWHTAFCVQHTAPMHNGFDVQAGGEALTGAQRSLIGEILCYAPDFSGYSTDISDPPTTTDFAKYTATQMAIWLVTVNKFGTTEGDRIAKQVCDKSKQAKSGQSYAYYEKIRDAVAVHDQIPSFTASTAGQSKIYEMAFNSSTNLYELTLVDDAKVIGSFAKNDAFNKNGISAAVQGNTLTLSSKKSLEGAVTLGFSRKIKDESKAYQLWWNPEDTSQQELVTVRGLVDKELQAYLKVEAAARNGYLNLIKTSGDPLVTEGNSCYELSGAEYTVYNTDKDGLLSGECAVLTTDGDGRSNTVELPPGIYYIRETKAARGYQLDETVYTIEVTSESTETEPVQLHVSDKPMVTDAALGLTKLINGEKTEQCPSLEGTLFTVKYYDGYYTADQLPGDSDRTWVIQIMAEEDQTYRAALNDTYKVSGDDFYYDEGQAVLPLGTVTIQETQAAPGYTLKGYMKDADGVTVSEDGERYVTKITEKGGKVMLEGGNTYSVYDTPVGGRIKIIKFDSDGRTPLKGVSFSLMDMDGHQVAEGTTGADGVVLFEDLYPDTYVLTETATVPGHSLLPDSVTITLPLQLTEEEADSQNIDTGKCIFDEKKSIYYVYDLTYEISNGANLTLPVTGGTNSIQIWLSLIIAFCLFAGAGFRLIGIGRKQIRR